MKHRMEASKLVLTETYLAHDWTDFQEQGRVLLLPQGSAIREVMEVCAVT